MPSERSAEPAPDFAAGFRVPIQGSEGSCQPVLSTEGSPVRLGLLNNTGGISFRRLMQLSDASSLNSLAALSAFSLRLLSTFSALARAAARGLSDLPCIGLVLRSSVLRIAVVQALYRARVLVHSLQ